jgi:hypothetical protein
MDWNELPLEPRLLGVPSGASKMINEPMECLVQTVNLSSTDMNDVSKRTEMTFHMTHITSEFHQVHPKWFLSLWYIRCKPCTYLASLNELKRDSMWPTSPSSSIVFIQNDFQACDMFSKTVHLSCTDTNTISKWTKLRFHMTHAT